MTEKTFNSLYRDLKFYGKVERLAISWWKPNSQYWERDLGFMNHEDLMSEAFLHLWKTCKDGQTQSYYLQAMKWKINELLKKAKRRNEIAPQETASHAWAYVNHEWVPVDKLFYSSSEGEDERSEFFSQE